MPPTVAGSTRTSAAAGVAANMASNIGRASGPSVSPLWAEAACRIAATAGASSGERGWIVIMAGLLCWG